MNHFHWRLLLGVFALGSVACGDDHDNDGEEHSDGDEIEIAGRWSSNFGGTEEIDRQTWSADYGMGTTVSEVVSFDNDANSAVLLAPDDAAFNPSTYSRNVWTEIDGDGFFYCTVSYGAESAEAAEEMSQSYDDTDPATGGCGDLDYPWTQLTRE